MPRRRFLLLTAALALASILINLRPLLSDTRPLDGHEIFVAQTAREMIRTGEWIIPQFNGGTRLRKPPLMYYAVIGVAETLPNAITVPPWAARLPAILSGAALIACTAGIGALIYDRRTGLLAALLALTSLGFFDGVNSARPEMMYAASCALLTLGLAGAWSSKDRTRQQLGWALVTWLGFALAFLAKGPHIPGLILAGFALGMALTGERRRILPVIRPLTGLILTLIVAGSWVAAVLVHRPDALAIWNYELLGDSASTRGTFLDYISIYYLYGVPALVLPWVVPLILGAFVTFERDRPDLRRGRALFWAIVFTVAIMSIPDHRRVYYVIPLLPAIAGLMARGTIDVIEKLGADPRRRPFLRALAAVHAVAALATFIVIAARSRPDQTMIAGVVAGGILVVASLLIIARAPLRPRTLIVAAALPWLVMPAFSDAPGWWRARRYELSTFCQDAAQLIGPTEPVYSISGLVSELVYTLDRPVIQVRTLDDIPIPPPGERAWAVGSPSEIKHPPPTLAVEQIIQMPARGSEPHERTILLSIAAAPESATPPDAPTPATPE